MVAKLETRADRDHEAVLRALDGLRVRAVEIKATSMAAIVLRSERVSPVEILETYGERCVGSTLHILGMLEGLKHRLLMKYNRADDPSGDETSTDE